LYETARDPFLMNVFGNDITIPNVQNHLAYTNQRFDQDSRQQILSIADSGRSITATGNNWKYLDIAADDVFNVTKTTVLKYEFDLSSPIGEQHAICMLNKDYCEYLRLCVSASSFVLTRIIENLQGDGAFVTAFKYMQDHSSFSLKPLCNLDYPELTLPASMIEAIKKA